MTPTPAELEADLRQVEDPIIGEDIVSLDLVNDVRIEGDTARVSLALNTPFAPAELEIGQAIRDLVAEAGLEPDLRAEIEDVEGFDTEVLPNVRNVIAVASGKGGVGKTTVAANLAAGLEDMGARVGLLDADIHGPNVPRILTPDRDPGITEDEKLAPPPADGVKLMSMDFLIEGDDDPAIMRGPMVNNVMNHFLRNVEWGQLDYLVVDLPPGTGDASLELIQTLPLTGTVIVTTPQPMSLDDARKGLKLFREHDKDIVGIVENMGTYHCPSCGDAHDPFGKEGAAEICESYDVDLLGKLPIHQDFGAEGIDHAVVKEEDSPVHDPTVEIVERIADRVGEINRRKVRDGDGDDEAADDATAPAE